MRTFFATCGALALMIPVGLLQSENTNAQDGFRKGNRRVVQAFSRVQRYNACNSRQPHPRILSLCGVEDCGAEGCDPRVSISNCRNGKCGLASCSTCQKFRRDFCESSGNDTPLSNDAQSRESDLRGQINNTPPNPDSRNRDSHSRRDARPDPSNPTGLDRPDRTEPVPREVQWRTDIRAANRESSETGRPILMKFSAKWCGPCKRMKAETFTDPALVAIINSRFIPVEIDTDQNEQLTRQLRIESVPTMMVISPDGGIVERREGFQSADQLKGAIARFSRTPDERPIVSNQRRPRFNR